MKRFWQIILGIAGLLLVTVIGLFAARTAIADHLIRSALEKRGFQNVALDVTQLGFSGATVENVSAGPDETSPDLNVTQASASWNFPDLLNSKIEEINVSGVLIQIEETTEGYLIAGMPVDLSALSNSGNTANSTSSSLTLDKLTLSDISATLLSEDSRADLSLEATYTRSAGGSLEVSASTDNYAVSDLQIENADIQLTATVQSDYRFNGAISSSADLMFDGTDYPDLAGTASFSGDNLLALATDWQQTDAQLSFELSAPSVPLIGIESYANLIEFFAGATPESVMVDARGLISLSNGTVRFENTVPDYLAAITNTGQAFTLTAPAGTLIGEWSSEAEYLDIAYVVEGLKASPAAGDMRIIRENNGPFRIESSFTASQWDDEDFTLVPGSISYTGLVDRSQLQGDIVISGGASRLNTNNMTLRNILGRGDFTLDADLEKREATITVPRGCVSLERPSATTQTGRFNFANASFCPPADGPIVLTASVNDTGTTLIKAEGIITANRIDAIVGTTSIAGTPPRAAVSVEIINRTATADTTLTGGNIQVNERVGFANIDGQGQASYKDGSISVDGTVSSLLLRDLAEINAFSPLIFAGDFALEAAKADFTGSLALPGVDSFSMLTGNYDLRARDGVANITFGPLTLNADGFQIVDVIPPLSGYVENADGVIGGSVQMRLASEGLQTNASLSIDRLTFNGPTRAVTQTSGLSLTADFDGLAPLQTRGQQSATIELIDLDALKLEDGNILFDAPGDGTLRISNATWPWFGGTLAIDNGLIPLDGSTISVPLQVRDIDLKALLDFIGVDGLTGEGRLEGELPVIIENGDARIVAGQLRAATPGRIAYDSVALQTAAENSGSAGQLAFDALSAFDFNRLILEINGALAGDVTLGLRMEGNSTEVVDNAGINYNININAPLSGLLRQLSEQQRRKEGVFGDAASEIGLDLEFGKIERVEPEEE